MKRTGVLVAAGEAGARHALALLLTPECEVWEAEDTTASLRLVDEVDPDVVLVCMGTADGSDIALLRHLKATARGLYLPILGLHADPSTRELALAAGADDCLGLLPDATDLHLRIRAFSRVRRLERQLRVQVERLERLGELKDDLVALLVHDLRNPLSGVRAILEAISLHGDTPYAAELEAALRGADRIQSALEDLLRVRQLEKSRLLIQAEPHNVRVLIDEAAASLSPVAVGRGVRFEIVASPTASIHVDGHWVQRALENLIGNALRYAPKQTAIQLHAVEDIDVVEIQVRDRGPGVPERVRPHLFQKFGQVSSADPGDRRGFGLGLYLVGLVASAHGGRVWASEPEGGGSRFHLTLPTRPGPRDER